MQPGVQQSITTKQRQPGRERRPHPVATIVSYAILGAFGALFLVPFAWLVTSSLKTSIAIFQFPPQWIPSPWVWSNYPDAMTAAPFGYYFRNSFILTGLNILGTILSCTLVAYPFARLQFPGRDFLFALIIATMLLPPTVTLIPQFLIFKHMGWLNSFYPLFVPAFFGNPFFIFLVRQFYMGIPYELEEAARIDGASSLRIWWNLMLPLSGPVVATIFILTFVGTWNNFLGPLIYLNSQELFTVSLGLAQFQGQYGGQYNLMMAAATVMLAPVIIIFFFGQRYFIEGVAQSGLTGR